MGSTSTAPAAFLGNSAFSTDFQNVITRAVGIASLPITQLQNQQTSLTAQQSELQTVGVKFQSVQAAIDSLNSSTGANSFSAAVSNTDVASAAVGAGALAGAYSINVLNVGSQTNTLSASGLPTVADPSAGNLSSSSSFTLTVDGQSFVLSDSSASLNGLVQAINSSGAKVQATIVNVGNSDTPNYRLSVQGSQYASQAIQLDDGTNNSILTTVSAGANVSYQVNGQPATPITSNSRSLTISPGLTANVLAVGTTGITVAQSSSTIESSLSSLVTAYNASVDELTKSRGQNGGALSGQSIVSTLGNSLRNLTSYSSGSGSVTSLADLGVTFDQTGHLQLDATVFNQAAQSSLSDVIGFLGSESGGGFLQAADQTLTAVTDSTTGSITQANQAVGASVLNVGKEITSQQDRVALLQKNLTSQIAAADAAISALEQQVTQITSLFAAMTQASKSITG